MFDDKENWLPSSEPLFYPDDSDPPTTISAMTSNNVSDLYAYTPLVLKAMKKFWHVG